MKKVLFYLTLGSLAFSCSNDDTIPENFCELTSINDPSHDLLNPLSLNREFTYSNGKLESNGHFVNLPSFGFCYFYGADGNLIRMGDCKMLDDFNSTSISYHNGRVDSVTTKRVLTGNVYYSYSIFTWGGNTLSIKYISKGQLTPESVTEYTFNGENIEKSFETHYVDYSNDIKDWTSEATYNYERTINPDYLWKSRCPGYPFPISKNNPTSIEHTYTPYVNGEATTPTSSTQTYTYTMASNNAIATQTKHYSDGSSGVLSFTYSNCK